MDCRDNTLGIDFGTTNTTVFCYNKGKVERLQIDGEDVLLLSAVAYSDEENYKCGKKAADCAKSAPLFVRNVKRVLGRNYDSREVQRNIYGCELREGIQDSCIFVNPESNKDISKTPLQVTTDIFKYIKAMAEEKNDRVYNYAFISYPSTFQACQKAALRESVRNAGFEIKGMITEPTAAGVHYRTSNTTRIIRDKDIVLVFDFGGGTLDLSLLVYENNAFFSFASGGQSKLGGNDVDLLIYEFVEKQCESQYGTPLFDTESRSYQRKRNKLLKEIERCKIELQSPDITEVRIEIDDDRFVTLTEEKLNSLIADILQKVMKCLKSLSQSVLKNQVGSFLGRHKIPNNASVLQWIVDSVILVGGSSNLKAVQKLLIDFFTPEKVLKREDIQECVGSGVFHSFLSTLESGRGIREVLYHPLTIYIDDSVYHIDKGTTSPFEVTYAHSIDPFTTTIQVRIEEDVTEETAMSVPVLNETINFREKLSKLTANTIGVRLSFGLDCILHVELYDYYHGDSCQIQTCDMLCVC